MDMGVNDNGDNNISFAQYLDSSFSSSGNGEGKTNENTCAAGQETQGERKVLANDWLAPSCNIRYNGMPFQ